MLSLWAYNYNWEAPPPEETELLGGIMTTTDPWNTLKKSERKKQKQAIDIIEDVLAELRSYEETPKSAYIKLSEKSENNIFIKAALEQAIPHDFIYITESQIEAILQKMTSDYMSYSRKIQDEETMLVLCCN